MNLKKGAVAVLLLIAGYFAAKSIASYLLVLMLGKGAEPFLVFRYMGYVSSIPNGYAPLQEHFWQIIFAGTVSFILTGLIVVPLLKRLLRSAPKSSHGDARFATYLELWLAGMFRSSRRGIIVGKKGGRLVRLDGQQFVILAAPTRSGKGVSVVVPNLLEYGESIVVLDIKQENFQLTSGWRASQGQKVYLFNPFAEDGKTHRWNPLGLVPEGHDERIAALMSIAAALYPDASADQKFWVSHARNAFMAFTLWLFETRAKGVDDGVSPGACVAPTLGAVYRLSSGNGSDLKNHFQRMSLTPGLSANARSAFANLLSQEKETFSSIMGSFQEPLNAWINPTLDAATSCNDFDLRDVRKQKMTIYIGIQPNKLAESRLIVNLFFSQLIQENTRTLPQNDSDLKYQCMLLMDEFTAIGKVEIISSAIAYIAGYNLRLVPVIQSMSQLNAVYGHENARTIITNHALQIIFAPREQQDAVEYSDMLGYQTVKREQVTRGHKRRDVSRSVGDEKRALLLPQELKALGPNKEIFMYEGLPHPVKCSKIRYYKQRRFRKRLLPAVDIAAVKVAATPKAPPARSPDQKPCA
nr:type IV secretory system conjugative DNA transfer family protein [Luteibacter sp. Sphag1AF]